MWTKYVVLALGLAACTSSAPAAPPLTCPQTLDTYCATASPKCTRQLDPKDTIGSFCKGTGPGVSFGEWDCPSGRILLDVGPQKWEFDPATHQLVTITEAGACVAGPASYTRTSETCKSWLVAYSCELLDGGVDGAADAKTD